MSPDTGRKEFYPCKSDRGGLRVSGHMPRVARSPKWKRRTLIFNNKKDAHRRRAVIANIWGDHSLAQTQVTKLLAVCMKRDWGPTSKRQWEQVRNYSIKAWKWLIKFCWTLCIFFPSFTCKLQRRNCVKCKQNCEFFTYFTFFELMSEKTGRERRMQSKEGHFASCSTGRWIGGQGT